MRNLHLVTHTHWDREWYLTFQQFRLKLVHLVDGLLDILDSDPQFKNFMLDGQTIILEDYLWMRPEREADLQRYVQEGRLTIGPWHILPDEFLVSPEATVRNLLQGEHTSRRFGPKMKVGYIPDPFGHIGQMPQILRGFGIESACLMRGLSDEPCEFWWQAPDGSRVFMAYLRDGYGNAAELPDAPEAFVSAVGKLRDSLAPHAASNHLLLMCGTDHMEPSPQISAAIAYAEGKLGGDRLMHSTLEAYIAAARASLDESRLLAVTGELRSSKRQHLLPGVLSTRMWVKQRNQACETLLEKWAEPFSTFAEMACDSFSQGTVRQPAPLLRQAWRLLMENHPHDSICGCSIDQVHAEMAPRFDGVEQIGERITSQSLEALAGNIRTTPPEGWAEGSYIPVVVFNPGGTSRSEASSVEVELPTGTGPFELLDSAGQSLPYQTMGLGSRELVNLELGASEFRRMAGMVSGGRVAGLNIQDFKLSRNEQNVAIDLTFSEKNEPDRRAWERGSRILAELLADATITRYTVHGRSVAATRLVFTAKDVPGIGYRAFWIRCQPAEVKPPQKINPVLRALLPLGARLAQIPLVQRAIASLAPDPGKKPPFRIENSLLRVELAADGTLTLTDKRSGAVYPGLNRFVDGGDCGDEYNYSLPEADSLVKARLKSARVERGAVVQALVLSLELETPLELAPDRRSRSQDHVAIPITCRVTLAEGAERVEIRTRVENRTRDHRLRVHFPAPFVVSEAWYDGHFEVVKRPVGPPPYDDAWVEQPRPEKPQRAFTDTSDGKMGLLVANRGLPEVEALKREDGNAEIALTLLRCVGWLSRDDFSTRKAHAGPPSVATPAAQMPGEWDFDYAIVPHAGADPLPAWQEAYAFQAPLRALSASLHAGSLPDHAALLSVEPPGFQLSAVKQAEDGDGWLARGYNLGDTPITACLRPWRPFARAWRASLAEEKLEPLNMAEDGSVSFEAHGHEIVTVRFGGK